MNTIITQFAISHRTALAAVCAAMLLGASTVYADDAVNMAPPVASAGQEGGGTGDGSAAADSVFNWTDVPQNQRVPVDRATFDAGGYQIYDNVGETIVVPFQNNNLYAMKFGVSDDGSTYFVNDGSAPILYMPRDAYLENATVAGARWYPFSPTFHPADPVYVGIAPTWDAYVDMGWYPGMYCWGGYWGYHPWFGGGVFLPMVGLFFVIGGHNYWGWGGYHSYFVGHPGWYHPGFYRPDYYHWAGHPMLGRPPFGSVAHPGFNRGWGHGGFNGGHSWNGGSSRHVFHGAGGGHSWGGGSHSWNGGGYHTFHGGGMGSSHSFGGGNSWNGGGHVFRGAGGGGHSWNGGGSSSHSWNGGGGHSFNGGGGGSHSWNGGGGHSFNSGGGGSHSWNGGGGHSFNGGGGGSHSWNGGGGGHSFNGGGGHSFGGGGSGHSSSGGGGSSNHHGH